MLVEGSVLQGRYRIERVIGEGGMGAVYLATEVLLGGKRVAIKEMHINIESAAARQQAIDQFQKEAHILATLEHPGIVDVTHYFEQGGMQYLVMAYVDGRTLDVVVNDSPNYLPAATLLDWMDQIADVLEYLHTHEPPIIFRDMKPTNVMLDVRNRIRLIDFGIARSFDATKTSEIIKGAGTAGFAPLEQFGQRGSSDARTDIYAMGATLYALITRTLPPFSVDLATLDAVLIPPRQINPDITPELEKVILTMMALRKEDRYPSMAEVKEALRMARAAGERQQAPAAAPRSGPPMARGLLQPRAGAAPPAAPNGPPRSVVPPLRPAAPEPPRVSGAPDEPLQVVRRRYCPKCRWVVPEGSDTCANCGATSDDRRTTPLREERPRTPTDKLEEPRRGPLTADTLRAVPVVQKPGTAAPQPVGPPKPRVQAVVTGSGGGGLFDFLRTAPALDHVTVVELKPASITFESSKPYKQASTVPIKVSVEPLVDGHKKAKPIVFDSKVQLSTVTELPGVGWRYVGLFKELPPHVRTLLESVPTSERRQAKRIRDSSQILSRDLPGYKSMGVDISMGGVGLVADGPAEVKAPVELMLDLGETATHHDVSGRVRLMARVVHCTKRPDGRYRLGLCFEGVSDAVGESLRQYLKRL